MHVLTTNPLMCVSLSLCAYRGTTHGVRLSCVRPCVRDRSAQLMHNALTALTEIPKLLYGLPLDFVTVRLKLPIILFSKGTNLVPCRDRPYTHIQTWASSKRTTFFEFSMQHGVIMMCQLSREVRTSNRQNKFVK